MTKIRATGEEVEIEGTASELERLSVEIAEFAESTDAQRLVPMEHGFDPAPYASVLVGICVRKSAGTLLLRSVEGALHIEGRADLLILLARNIAALAGASAPDHIHFDSISWPDDIQDGSADLVLSLRDDD